MRTVLGVTGASGSIYAVDFLRRCPGEKYLIVTKWGKRVMHEELGVKLEEITKWATKTFEDWDLASPLSSGSNHFDSLVVMPCTISTMAKIASGIADTLITRVASVALKEKRRLILALRETPLDPIALENALRLARLGAVVMPICPPHYMRPETVDQLVEGYVDKVLAHIGAAADGRGWRAEELE